MEAHGLAFPVGEGAPAPLDGAEAEVLQPESGEAEVDGPHGGGEVVELVVVHVAVPVEGTPDEEQAHGDAGEDVVGQRHLAYGGYAGQKPAEEACAEQEEEHGGVAERAADAADVVGDEEPEAGLDMVEVSVPGLVTADGDQRPGDAEADDGGPGVGTGRELVGEESGAEEGHAEEHHAEPVAEAGIGADGFTLEGVLDVGDEGFAVAAVVGDILLEVFGGERQRFSVFTSESMADFWSSVRGLCWASAVRAAVASLCCM